MKKKIHDKTSRNFWYKIKCAFFPTSCVHSTNIHPTNFLSNNFVLLTSLSDILLKIQEHIQPGTAGIEFNGN